MSRNSGEERCKIKSARARVTARLTRTEFVHSEFWLRVIRGFLSATLALGARARNEEAQRLYGV